MRTTITIDDETMKQLRRFEKQKNAAEAIRAALKKYLHFRRVEEFMQMPKENLLRDDYMNDTAESETVVIPNSAKRRKK